MLTGLSVADTCSSTTNLVANCGFESGTFAGWTLSGPQSGTGYLGISHGVDAVDAHSGSYGAYLAGFGQSLQISQLLSTVPGQSYTITYYLSQSPDTPAPYVSTFAAYFNGALLGIQSPALAQPFLRFQYTASASATATLLAFQARSDTGFFSLDDVSVAVATPEPATATLLVLPACLAVLGLKRRARGLNVLPITEEAAQ